MPDLAPWKGRETAEMSNERWYVWLVLMVEEPHPLMDHISHLVKNSMPSATFWKPRRHPPLLLVEPPSLVLK